MKMLLDPWNCDDNLFRSAAGLILGRIYGVVANPSHSVTYIL